MNTTALIALVTQQIDAQQAAPRSLLDLLIQGWLHEKWTRTQSEKTLTAYADTLLDFRARLANAGIELDDQAEQALTQISLAAQGYASHSARPGKQVAGSTHNQRLAIISSFFEYAIRQGGAIKVNPIKRAKRAKVERYKGVQALDKDTIERKLAQIDVSTRQGKRDYAIMAVLLNTGRRLSEVANLRVCDLLDQAGRIRVEFVRCKGGKQKTDLLPVKASTPIMLWLQEYYGQDIEIGKPGDHRPVWLSLSNRVHDGKLGDQSFADICYRCLGIAKVHVTRHSFTRRLIELGIKLPDLQELLGHESLDTTGIYAKSVINAENPFADSLAESFGF